VHFPPTSPQTSGTSLARGLVHHPANHPASAERQLAVFAETLNIRVQSKGGKLASVLKASSVTSRSTSMYAKLASVLLVSVVLFSPGVALADPPADRCRDTTPDTGVNNSPGDINQGLKEIFGTPGNPNPQNTDLSGSDFAQERNLTRQISLCFPPGLPPN